MDAAADEYELFDILTQNLIYSGADDDDDLPELFSQVPLLSDIDLGLPQDPSLNSPVQGSHEICKESDAQAETHRPSRFGPLLSESDISGRQKASVAVNTRKNSNWVLNVWRDWAEYRKKQNLWMPRVIYSPWG